MSGDQLTPESAITSFLTDADSVRSNAIIAAVTTHAVAQMTAGSYKQFLESCPQDPTSQNYCIPPEKVRRLQHLQAQMAKAQRAGQITSRASIVSLVSQYDAFMSALVRSLFEAQPGLVKCSKKTFDASDLLAFSSIDELKRAIIDEEIEDLLRESHHEQFAWLERRFDLKTLRAFDSWPEFVEITQRRNLFVHTDGKVSKQYLAICAEQGSKVRSGLAVGDQLDADTSYVRSAADTLVETAVKLTQVLWRKTMPDQLEPADKSLIRITYNLLERKRYKLAIKLLDFGLDTIKRFSATEHRLRILVNRANAYRLSGNKEKCASLVSTEDWSACDRPFRLAAHLLTDDMSAALDTMKQIGSDGSPSKTDYREWPLFEGYRELPEFRSTFKEIFGEELVVPQVVDAKEQPAGDVPTMFDFLDAENADQIITQMATLQSGS